MRLWLLKGGLRARAVAAFACVLVLAFATTARAQESVWLTGRVSGPGDSPEIGARIQATGERGESVEARTDASGHFRLRLPGGGSRFVVSVDAANRTPVTRVLTRAAGDGPELVVNFTLELAAVALAPLAVRVPRLSVAETTRWTPGSVDQSRAGIQLRREPLGSDELADLADRQVGVARNAAAEGSAFSIAGQPPDQTRLTMDGAALGAAIPREAVRSVVTLTNTYDVARGQFTGGQIDVQTQQAGNRWGGSGRLQGRPPWLQYGDAPSSLRRHATYLGADAGGGGALLRDRVFAYGAFTLRMADARGLSLDGRAGREVAPAMGADSLARFLEIAAPLRPNGDAARQQSRLGSGLLRLDAVLSPRHTLMVRLNGQRSRAEDGGSMSALAGTGSATDGSVRGVLAELNSGARNVANRLRVSLSSSSRDWLPADPAPYGQVNVTSETSMGRDFTVLRFAGNPLPGRDTRQSVVEATDEVVLTTRDRRHRFRLGAETGAETYRGLLRADPGGFSFGSLAELEAGRPALFTRSLRAGAIGAEVRRTALFADEHWRGENHHLSVGVRAERTLYPGPRDISPTVGPLFGATPGALPSRWRLSPRVGFAVDARMPWDRGPNGKTGIQGGFGEFTGVLPLPSLAAALAQTGLADAADLVCAGPAAPRPDWAAYRADPGTIPQTCAGGASTFASRLPNATLFAPGFTPPRVWRASLNGQGALRAGVIWHFTTAYVRGVNQPVAFDRNLRRDPVFTNAWEGNRPVYVSESDIDALTGAVSRTSSRLHPEFGTVRELTAEGRSRSLQVSAGAFRLVGFAVVQVGYTWTNGWETVSPLGGPAVGAVSTGGDPLRLEEAAAAYTPRHMLNAWVDWRRSNLLSLMVVARLSSGTPFTPMVAGDVNGDGAQNDRAFIFDPRAAGDETLARGMEHVLRNAPGGVRHCLERQAGRVAAHNSCQTSWTPSLDLNARFNLGNRVDGPGYRRATIWLQARNLTAGLDYLLHGPRDLRGWGQFPSVDNTLLSVRSFDPAARAFRYDINPRFGRAPLEVAANRVPFAISIQARIVIGSDRVVTAFRSGQRARGPDEALSPANLRLHIRSQLRNTPAEVLALNAPRRLYLTPAQAEQLRVAADSAEVRTVGVVEELLALISTPAQGKDYQERVRALARQATTVRSRGMEDTRAILTQEQWAKLPEPLRGPGAAFTPYPPETVTSPSNF